MGEEFMNGSNGEYENNREAQNAGMQSPEAQSSEVQNSEVQNAETQYGETRNIGEQGAKMQNADIQSVEAQSSAPQNSEPQGGVRPNPYQAYDTNRRPDANRFHYNQGSNQQDSQMGNNQNGGNDNRNNWQNHPNGNQNGGFGKSLLKIVCAAAVFGLVAGGIFFGVERLSNVIAQDLKKDVPASSQISQKDDQAGNPSGDGTEESKNTETVLPGKGTTIASTRVLSEADSDITDLSNIVDNVMPSIVAVDSAIERTYTDPFSFYGGTQKKTVPGSGSGVIYGEDETNMYIVTNNHVIDNAVDVKVRFCDDTSATAIVKGSDSDVDLAILAVKKEDVPDETLRNVRQIAIGSSDQVKVGEMVIVIGNALGYGQSMTAGYVSAKDRTVTFENGVTMSLIQTDAAINPGNSGGALLNMKGELIGITNSKYATTDVEGMGFAIPISSATSIIKELEETEVLADDEKGYLGVSIEDISSSQAEMYSMPVGIYITEVAKGGAAEKAGILKGDIVVAVNGTKVETRSAFQKRITSKKIGTTVSITLMRSE